MKMEKGFSTLGSLDCCKDPDCEVCKGTGYLLPRKKAIEKKTQENDE